jgi:hypothetical protein
MAYDRYLIAPINSGLQTDLKPWLTPDDSFEILNNAYVFRGRVKKRFGSKYSGTGMGAQASWFSRLRIALPASPLHVKVGVIAPAPAPNNILPNPTIVAFPGTDVKVGDYFSVGADTFTVASIAPGPQNLTRSDGLGNPASFNVTTGALIIENSTASTDVLYNYFLGNAAQTDVNGDANGFAMGSTFKIGQAFSIGTQFFTVVVANGNMLTTGIGTGTFNTATGAFSFTGVAAHLTQIYFYPSLPVMGIGQYEVGAINNQPTFAWDTEFAYKYAAGQWNLSNTSAGLAPVRWHGTNANFFWSCNWRGANTVDTAMFVTNFNATDPMWSQINDTWSTFNPRFLTAGSFVQTARIIVPFKNRLVLLSTIENVGGALQSHTNRARYSHNGSPFDPTSWYEQNQVGYIGGGYNDAPTKEQIIGAEFIRDRLIVYFEESTWELASTGNNIQPFEWYKLNTELGSQAMNSSVPFDKAILTVGKTGIHACNGVNVDRIDDKIPDDIFKVRNTNNGADRICGIRDYYTEMVYWSMPVGTAIKNYTDTYPNKVLVFNYATGSWAFNDDCITAFGYFEQQLDRTWAGCAGITWANANFSWNSGVVQAQFRRIFAGNQQGYVFIVAPEESSSAGTMQLTQVAGDVLTIVDHTCSVGDYIKIENASGLVVPVRNFQILEVVNANMVRIDTALAGAYLGGGTVARVPYINIRTKQFNPYIDKGKNVYLAKIDFCVSKTTAGAITVDYAPSSTNLSIVQEAMVTGSNLGTNILETSPYVLVPLETEQRQLWHAIYFQTDGEYIQLQMYFNSTQMIDDVITTSRFELQGMVLYTMPISRLQ